MKPWTIALIIVAIIGALGYVYVRNQEPQLTSLPEGTVIYDVRTADEFATSRVTSALPLPLADIRNGTMPDVPKDTSIAVYCESGRRSAEAVKLLKKAGYTNIIDMHGIADTANYGLSIVR